ncbi:short-chain dehydrogenase, partial [Sulfurimonas sp. MAG313]|nr:short-chain dehydrogenase [Sulfurimonas sp. MAG313]
PFTKNSTVVISNIVKALEKDKPKARYYNTSATHIFGALKRILPTHWLDKILIKI